MKSPHICPPHLSDVATLPCQFQQKTIKTWTFLGHSVHTVDSWFKDQLCLCFCVCFFLFKRVFIVLPSFAFVVLCVLQFPVEIGWEIGHRSDLFCVECRRHVCRLIHYYFVSMTTRCLLLTVRRKKVDSQHARCYVGERTYHVDRAVLFKYQHLLGTTG